MTQADTQSMTFNTERDPYRADYINGRIFNQEYLLFRDCSIEDCGETGKLAWETILKGKSLYIHGDVGRGKTHLALACLKRWLEQGYPGYIFTASDILDRCRHFVAEKNDEGMSILLHGIIKFPLLIIDDLGVQNNTAWTDEKLYEIINSRYLKQQEQITIVTSNYKPSELISRFHSDVMGKRIVDRLVGMCERIELKGPSRRLNN